MDNRFDVIVIGGGQSGLAMGYYLRRTGLSYIILYFRLLNLQGGVPHSFKNDAGLQSDPLNLTHQENIRARSY